MVSIILAVLAGLAIAALLFRVFFTDFADFRECIGYSLTPNIVSLFRGESMEDRWASMKLFVYLGISALVGFAAWHGLAQ